MSQFTELEAFIVARAAERGPDEAFATQCAISAALTKLVDSFNQVAHFWALRSMAMRDCRHPDFDWSWNWPDAQTMNLPSRKASDF